MILIILVCRESEDQDGVYWEQASSLYNLQQAKNRHYEEGTRAIHLDRDSSYVDVRAL